jgi:hypothetical protein
MMIWRSLSPRTLASVLEHALERQNRMQAAARPKTVEQSGGTPIARPTANERTTVNGTGR